MTQGCRSPFTAGNHIHKICDVIFVAWMMYGPSFVVQIYILPNKYVPKTWIQKSKVKCTLVQTLRLCTGRTAYRASRGIALPFHDHGTKRGWGVSVTPWPLFIPGKDPVPIVQEAGWAPGPVWTGAENLVPTGTRSPDRPARSQSLYWLRYPALVRKSRLINNKSRNVDVSSNKWE